MYIKYNSVQKFNSFIIVNAFIPQVGFLGIVWELDPLHRVCEGFGLQTNNDYNLA